MNKIIAFCLFFFFVIFYGCNLNNPFQATTYIKPESEPTPGPTAGPTAGPTSEPTPTPAIVKWISYNDCIGSDTGNAPNVTEFNLTNTDGILLKYSDGTATSVSVHISSSNVVKYLGGMPAEGTDAYIIFNGIVNIDESACFYNEALDWFHEITFNGLNPSTEYEFITTSNRDEASFAGTHYTKFTISGADTYTNISSTGVVIVSEGIVKMDTGYNTENGYVVGWSGITAVDGTFTVRSENVGAEGPGLPYQSYGFQGFVFKEFE